MRFGPYINEEGICDLLLCDKKHFKYLLKNYTDFPKPRGKIEGRHASEK